MIINLLEKFINACSFELDLKKKKLYTAYITHGLMAVYNSVRNQRVRLDVSLKKAPLAAASICDLTPPTQTNAHKDQTTTLGTLSPTFYEQ